MTLEVAISLVGTAVAVVGALGAWVSRANRQLRREVIEQAVNGDHLEAIYRHFDPTRDGDTLPARVAHLETRLEESSARIMASAERAERAAESARSELRVHMEEETQRLIDQQQTIAQWRAEQRRPRLLDLLLPW